MIFTVPALLLNLTILTLLSMSYYHGFFDEELKYSGVMATSEILTVLHLPLLVGSLIYFISNYKQSKYVLRQCLCAMGFFITILNAISCVYIMKLVIDYYKITLEDVIVDYAKRKRRTENILWGIKYIAIAVVTMLSILGITWLVKGGC